MFPHSRIITRVLSAWLFLTLCAASGRAQQTDVQRFDLYAGFAGFETPKLNLAQRGFHVQGGENVNRWLSIGFDYSEGSGHNALSPKLLRASLQQTLGAEIEQLILAGVIPPNYQLVVPTDASSQTFAFGPQLAYRHFRQATLFVRPSLGAIRQRVTPKPVDPVAKLAVAQLVPAGTKVDWQGFYGFGGGGEWLATPHIGLRAQGDLVYWRLFNDLLAKGTWTTRYAVGLTWHWGRNVVAPAGH
jgi:hypothetical protein